METMCTDFHTWFLDVGYDRVFRILKYRRVGDWTPEEIDKKYIDQSQYVDSYYHFVKIKEAIELPDGDILIGFVDFTDLNCNDLLNVDFNRLSVSYEKLSQIHLDYFPEDEQLFYIKEDNYNDE